jgi:uncharacterized protein (TIGR01777 family)
MRILVSGSSGLIGSALLAALVEDGHEVRRLIRISTKSGPGGISWDPSAGILDATNLEGFGAVIHLAGESIAGRRWTVERKRRILESRKRSTRLLADTLSHLMRPPPLLISASAIGYYGDRGAELLCEESPPGSGFLPEVCLAWEEATQPASQGGIRVINLRIGLVLSTDGGALAQMLLPFRLGLGGKFGSGCQYMSWIALDDLVSVFRFSIENGGLAGPVNAVSPEPVTNLEFTRMLGEVLSRPTLLPVPAFLARLLMGKMADELLLASARVKPARLLAAGFKYGFPELKSALRHVLA